jgi:curli production assembly/transport component CsgG
VSPWTILALVILCTTIFKPVGVEKPAAIKPPREASQATFVSTTAVHKNLVLLPPPEKKMVVAAYQFADRTGQYKYSTTVATQSRAVTQGATSMLIKALEDSGWFIPIEREGLHRLLKEREIVNETRNQYKDKQGQSLPPLPPLLYAGILLEGGIISYDTNIITGGFGAKYFGLGGDIEHRKDQVTIYLRAVSVQTGKVLKSVSTTKTIFSKEVRLGIFRYVSLKKLLEAETGLTTNEPPQMCVLEAIEKAVLSLIIEGVLDELWALKNPEDIKSPIIQSYLEEKKEVEQLLQFDKKGNLVSAGDVR